MSVAETQLTELNKVYADFKVKFSTHVQKLTILEGTFMNGYEDFCEFMKVNVTNINELLLKYDAMIASLKLSSESSKFDEGNFNKVSLIKKQDMTIRQQEIKIAELELKLSSYEKDKTASVPKKPVADPVADPVHDDNVVATTATVESVPSTHQCYARKGKAKYNIVKQGPTFMESYPPSAFVTKSGCVVGMSCPVQVSGTDLFCPEHNTGKFEDIRTEPGTSTLVTSTDTKAVRKPRTKTNTVAVADEPVAKEPVAVADESVSQEPVAVADESVSQEPVAVADESVAVADEPVAVADEPVAVAQEPVAVAQEPVAVADEPVAVANEPVAVADEPVADEPVAVAKEPVAVADEPVAVAKEPVAVADEPVAVAKEPVAVAKEHKLPPKPEFDDLDYYTDTITNKVYYQDTKNNAIYEIAPDSSVGAFIKLLE